MKDISLVCTLDGADYKEYEVLMDGQPLGVISWKEESSPSGNWYTTASDGVPRYFQTQAGVIDFLLNNPLESANQLSAKLRAEANRLINIAEEIETD